MKVIFLDCDGVLNSESFAEKMLNENNLDIFHLDLLDPVAIHNLEEIVAKTNSKIVLSSSWRLSRESYSSLKTQLKRNNLEIYDTTVKELLFDRELEIAKWLADNSVESFVILDDFAPKKENPLWRNRWIVTNPANGLTEKDVETAIYILNEEKAA